MLNANSTGVSIGAGTGAPQNGATLDIYYAHAASSGQITVRPSPLYRQCLEWLSFCAGLVVPPEFVWLWRKPNVYPHPQSQWHQRWRSNVRGSGGVTANELILSQLTTPVNAAFSTSNTGGTLAPGTYYYRVAATDATGTTLASTETSKVVPGGTSTNTITVNWGAVPGATGYKVYGRSTGAELLMATVPGGGILAWTDTGAVTPSGALPTANTTGVASVANLKH